VIFTFMKRRGTIVDFPYQTSGLNGDEENSGFRHSRRRARTLSQFSVSSQSSKLALDLTKLATVTTESYQASGSFSPTSSAKASLISLVDHTGRSSLDLFRSGRPVLLCHGNACASPTLQSPETTPPSSPLFIKSSLSSIPSISRTSSSFSASDTLSNRGLSKGHTKSLSLQAEGRYNKLHPVLAACEKMSKVSSRAVCSTCTKPGYDYPRCAKCGDMVLASLPVEGWGKEACMFEGEYLIQRLSPIRVETSCFGTVVLSCKTRSLQKKIILSYERY